jgi:signal peptidase I
MLNFIKNKKQLIRDFFSSMLSIIIIVVVIVFFKYTLVEPFMVSGSSMSPNFETGHYILINKLYDNFSDIKRGDVLVFVPPQNRSNS